MTDILHNANDFDPRSSSTRADPPAESSASRAPRAARKILGHECHAPLLIDVGPFERTPDDKRRLQRFEEPRRDKLNFLRRWKTVIHGLSLDEDRARSSITIEWKPVVCARERRRPHAGDLRQPICNRMLQADDRSRIGVSRR